MTVAFPQALDRLRDRYPSLLVDRIDEHEPGRRLAAVKNVTVNEEYFQGHYPGAPLLPAVLTIEALAQVATLLLIESHPGDVALRGVNRAKFRRQVVPGDRLRLEVTLRGRRGPLVFVEGVASVEGQAVAEAELVLTTVPAGPAIDPSARVHSGANIGSGTVVGPFAVIGPNVVLGRDCRVGASAVIDGNTSVGDGTEIFPFASIGLPPQDLKYRGEDTRLIIGCRNVFREFVTIHRGTAGGGGETTIGDHNLFMAYAHVAHDCHIGHHTIFGNAATLGGHVTVEDYAAISAYSGVHQFCRVGRYAFVGGYSVVTKDALPFARSVGNRARVYGINTVGLIRRGFTEERVAQLKRAYRYLLQSKLNTTQALLQIEQDPALACDEVAYLVAFIRTTKRGVILRRGGRRADDAADDCSPMKLGLIAGNGRFPFLVLEAARSMGHEVTVVAIKEEAFKDLEEAAARPGPAAAVHWISLGQLGGWLKILKQAGVSRAVMAGQVKHTKIFGGIVPDMTALSVLTRLKSRNTDAIIAAVADVMREHGVELIDSTALLQPMLAREGVMTRRAPTADEYKDLEFGYRMADTIAGLDIGQTIAVKHQAVVAVEAMEGTDETIARAGHLAGPGVAIIKVAKPGQDMRFDVPVVGLATVQAMRRAGAALLSLDAGQALMFERDTMLASANEAGIAIVGRVRPERGAS